MTETEILTLSTSARLKGPEGYTQITVSIRRGPSETPAEFIARGRQMLRQALEGE